MSADAVPMQFVPALAPEEAARARLYGLLARLFYAPPDAPLLAALASDSAIDSATGSVALAWRELARAAAQADPDAVREEYEALFVGTGKAPVTPYTTAYTVRFASESPLAELRNELRARGLARLEGVHEPEDHIAALLDVMRHLVSEDRAHLAVQKKFFERWVERGANSLCAAIDTAHAAVFYKAVARLAARFLEIEHSAFEMI